MTVLKMPKTFTAAVVLAARDLNDNTAAVETWSASIDETNLAAGAKIPPTMLATPLAPGIYIQWNPVSYTPVTAGEIVKKVKLALPLRAPGAMIHVHVNVLSFSAAGTQGRFEILLNDDVLGDLVGETSTGVTAARDYDMALTSPFQNPLTRPVDGDVIGIRVRKNNAIGPATMNFPNVNLLIAAPLVG